MRWFKRSMRKIRIAIVGLLLLLVLMVWVPVSTVGAYEGASGLTGPVRITVQATPPANSTITAETANEQLRKLQRDNDRSWQAWFWNNGATLISSLFLGIAGVFTLFRYLRDQRNEREKQREDHQTELEKRAEERFQAAVTGLGNDKEGTKIGAAILLRTFLRPGYEQFYTQTFDLAVANLCPIETPNLPEDPKTPLLLTRLRQALILVFKEAFPLARSQNKGSPQSLDASYIQLDNAYLVGADLKQIWMPQASIRKVDLSGANLSGANLSGAILSEANLSEADLSGANLSGANLSGAILSEANLSGADLSGAILSNTNLSGVDLSEANLSGAHLREIDLSKANLSGAKFSRTIFSKAILSGVNLSGVDLRGADLRRATINLAADLSQADLSQADLRGAHLEDVHLSGAHLNNANLSGAHLSRSVLRGITYHGASLNSTQLDKADLTGANLVKASFIGADLSNAILKRANLNGANFKKANLTRADFSKAFLYGVDMRQAQSLADTNLRGVRGLTIEQLTDYKAKGAIIDEGSTPSSSPSPVSTSPSSQSNDAKDPSAPPAQESTPTPDKDVSSAALSQQDQEP